MIEASLHINVAIQTLYGINCCPFKIDQDVSGLVVYSIEDLLKKPDVYVCCLVRFC